MKKFIFLLMILMMFSCTNINVNVPSDFRGKIVITEEDKEEFPPSKEPEFKPDGDMQYRRTEGTGLDIDTDDNTAVDITYGGTNATSAGAALTNLGAESETHASEHALGGADAFTPGSATGIDPSQIPVNEGQIIVGTAGNVGGATSTIPNLAITVALATDDTWSGFAYTANAGYTSGSGEQWRVLFLDPNDANNEWQKADANVAGDFPAWGVATSDATTDGSALVVLFRGCFRNDAWQGTYADGALLYLSETAGAFTDTAPTDSTDCVQPIGRVRDNGVTCIICINFDPIAGWATVP